MEDDKQQPPESLLPYTTWIEEALRQVVARAVDPLLLALLQPLCGTDVRRGLSVAHYSTIMGLDAERSSELADLGDWALSEPLVSDLKTTTARAMYDHSSTRAIWFYMYAGASGTLYSGVLPGQDDEAVAYHSSGGVSGSSGAAFCNPSDWFCNDLTLGTAANEGGRAKWGYHSVKFRDDNEAYNHYTNGNWAGVTSLVRSDMVNNAR